MDKDTLQFLRNALWIAGNSGKIKSKKRAEIVVMIGYLIDSIETQVEDCTFGRRDKYDRQNDLIEEIISEVNKM